MAITISGSGITSANIADGTITTDDILASDVKNLKSGRKNILINGDVRVSQRGDYTASTTMTHNVYMLDRWKNYAGVTSTIQDLGGYVEIKATAASGASTIRLSQLVEDLYQLEGQVVTVSCEMKSNSINGRLQMHNGSWVATSAAHTGGGDWENLSFTTTMPSSLTVTSIHAGIDGASSADVAIAIGDYCQIKNVQLELGSVATDFEHRSYGEELALCQRYCVGIFADGSNRGFVAQGHAHNANNPVFWRQHSTPMRVIPSISYSSANDFNCDRGWTGNNLLAGLAIQTLRSSPECIALIGTTSGLVGGDPATLDFTDLINGYIIFDAEL
jgi:hypothetical protein